MNNLDVTATLDPRNAQKASQSAWHVYGRLMGYAWRYKVRLVVSLFFAMVVAVSFGSMLFSTGGLIKLIFGDVEAVHFLANQSDAAQLKAYIEEDGAFAGDPEVSETEQGFAFRIWLVNEADDAAFERIRLALTDLGAESVAGYPRDSEDIAERLEAFTAGCRDTVGWAPSGLAPRFRTLVDGMRARTMVAIATLSVLLVVLCFVAGVARFIQEYFAGSIGADITVTLMREMYENVIRQPLIFFEQRTTGELLARFTNDVFMVNRGLTRIFVKLLREPFKVLVFLGLALWVDPLLTIVGFGVLPPVGYVIVVIGKKVRRSVRRSLTRIGNVASVAKESFSGILIVKGFCMENYHVERVQAELIKLRRYLRQMLKADAAVGPLSEMVMVIGVVIFMVISGKRVEAGLMDGGDLVVLYFSLAGMLDPMRKLASVNNAVQTSVASAERVFEFIDARSDLVEAPGAVELPRLEQSIRFDNVHFTYPAHDATDAEETIKGVTFDVPKGQMVALVGFSGAGKTTLAKLIPRFYDPSEGAITFDGTDLRRATLKSLRQQIGIVTQEVILFDDTVREAISRGAAQCTDSRVEEAAHMAQAADFIERLSEGYDTRIGEGGGTLSGGQRQRLAIARALAGDPAVLILDEATSSLDSESERAIQQAIEDSIVGRTTIVIAHRLSTILRADQILVMDQGRIVERGTHDQLIDHDGIYKRLYEVQFAASTHDGE